MRILALLLLVFALTTHGAQRQLRTLQRSDAPLEETLPSSQALRWLALGYRSLVADYYWLRALEHFGDARFHEALYPNLKPFMERVLALDPYFSSAYLLAATALTLKGMDPKPSVKLLQHGLKHRPDDWRIPYFLGFNAYYFLQDYTTAAHALGLAAKHPEAPSHTLALATRLAAHNAEPEMGLALLDTILPTIIDEELQAVYDERRRLLLLEVGLKELGALVQQYEITHQRKPRRLADLVDAGMLPEVPKDPLGGQYFLDNHGQVQTTSHKKRLKLESQR